MPQGHYGFPNILQLVRTTSLKVLGKPGATAGAGLAGGTTSGAPTTGQFDVCDAIVAANGHLWICTVAGTPGTWVDAGASSGYTDPLSTRGDLLVRGAASTGRLALGASGYVLTSDGTDAAWAAAAAGFADPTTTKGDLIVHGASTTRLAVGSDTQVLTADSTQSAGVKWAAAGAASLTSSSAYLGANVTMTNANTYYDGPTISLAAGTWLVTGVVTLEYTGAAAVATAKLWDGTTTTSSTQQTAGYSSIALSALVSPGSTTTYKISCAHQSAGCLIRAAATVNAAGNTASFLCALKVA